MNIVERRTFVELLEEWFPRRKNNISYQDHLRVMGILATQATTNSPTEATPNTPNASLSTPSSEQSKQ